MVAPNNEKKIVKKISETRAEKATTTRATATRTVI